MRLDSDDAKGLVCKRLGAGYLDRDGNFVAIACLGDSESDR